MAFTAWKPISQCAGGPVTQQSRAALLHGKPTHWISLRVLGFSQQRRRDRAAQYHTLHAFQ